MATYFTSDFADFSTDWTERYNTTLDITVSGGELTIPSGVAADWSAVTWNDVDGDSARADVEVLFRVKATGLAAARRSCIVRASGSDESATHWHFSLLSTQYSVGYCSGSDARTNVSTKSGESFSADTYYWVRFRITGSSPTTYQCNVWAGAVGDEPSSWGINSTTSSGPTAAGWVGFSTFDNPSYPITFDQLGVGTNGDTAPSSAPATGITTSARNLLLLATG